MARRQYESERDAKRARTSSEFFAGKKEEKKLRRVRPDHVDAAFRASSRALEFATNHFREFVFRGREIKQHRAVTLTLP